jgi:hypothetical protein
MLEGGGGGVRAGYLFSIDIHQTLGLGAVIRFSPCEQLLQCGHLDFGVLHRPLVHISFTPRGLQLCLECRHAHCVLANAYTQRLGQHVVVSDALVHSAPQRTTVHSKQHSQ